MTIDKGVDHRGIWRAIYVSLWDDPEFLKFTRVEKLVFLNLRTGPQCNLPAIFRYSLDMVIMQTRTKSSSVRLALRTLSEKNWIKTEAGIVWIKKGLKYDPNVTLTNPKHMIAIKNAILSLPKLQIVRDFIDYYKIPIAYTIAYPKASPIGYANQEKEEDKDEDKKKDEDKEKEEESEGKGKPNAKPKPFLSDLRSDPHIKTFSPSLKEDPKKQEEPNPHLRDEVQNPKTHEEKRKHEWLVKEQAAFLKEHGNKDFEKVDWEKYIVTYYPRK